MLELFEQGLIDQDGKKHPYGIIVTGMAPGGNVTIWMQGGGINTELIKFKAKNQGIWGEDDKNYQDFEKRTNSSTGFINSEANIFRNLHGIPYSIWETGEKEYNYDIGFIDIEDKDFYINIILLAKDGSYIFFNKPTHIRSYNQWLSNDISKKLNKGKIPVHIKIQWTSNDNLQWYEGEVVLPTNFKKIFIDFKNENETVNLLVLMNKLNTNLDYALGSIWLQSDTKKQEIMKIRLAKLNNESRKYNVSKYSIPKDFVFPKWEGREALTFPEIDFWQEKSSKQPYPITNKSEESSLPTEKTKAKLYQK